MRNDPSSEAADSYYRALQARVRAWLEGDAARRVPCSVLYRHLPDLYRFLVGLALDARLAAGERGWLVSTLKYIVAPHDYVPEAILGVPGLCDDLVLAALAVDRLHQTCEPSLLDDHWRFDGSPREIASEILAAAGALVDHAVLRRLEALLANRPA